MRTRDIEAINGLANMPHTLAFFGVEGFDFTDALANEQNIFLLHDGALAICEWSAPRVYQCHLIFAPDCRGRRAVRAAVAMRDHMLANHADLLWGQPAIGNVEARKLIRMAGFEPAGFGENPIVGPTEHLICRQSSLQGA